MYTLAAIQIEKNIYAMPTESQHDKYTYCYIFKGNDFNWDVRYSHGQFVENKVLHGMAMIDNVLEMGNDAVQDLHELHCWEDIENNFTEFWKRVLTKYIIMWYNVYTVKASDAESEVYSGKGIY